MPRTRNPYASPGPTPATGSTTADRGTSPHRVMGAAKRAPRSSSCTASPVRRALLRLPGGDEDAWDAGRLVQDGTERQGEVGLHAVPVPVEREEEVVGEGALATPQRALDQGADDVPEVAPALTRGTPEAP